ncbi:MAG: hypothetical protein ACP5L4_06330, partial [Thermoplasmata archaeon]
AKRRGGGKDRMISIEVVEEEKDIIYNYHGTKNFNFEKFSDSRERVRSVAKNVNKGGKKDEI